MRGNLDARREFRPTAPRVDICGSTGEAKKALFVPGWLEDAMNRDHGRRSEGGSGIDRRRREQRGDRDRRSALKTLVAGSAAAGFTLPDNWKRPVVQALVLPAHAQTTAASSPVNDRNATIQHVRVIRDRHDLEPTDMRTGAAPSL